MRWLRLGVVVLALAAVGCPQPKKSPAGPAGSPPAKTEQGGGAKTDAPAGGEGQKTDAKTGEGPSEPKSSPAPASGPAWNTIPEDLVQNEHFYPQLKPAASWPDPAGLTPVAKAKEKVPAVKIRVLKELVELCVHKDLQPKDADAALGIDAEGRLFMRLGKTKDEGSASLDTVPKDSKFPVFAMTFKRSASGPHTMESLTGRVAKVVNPKLLAEIQRNKDTRFAASPQVKGPARAAGLALLDRAGAFGVQFPYVYVFGDDDHLVVLLQEVPDMGPSGPPR